MLDQRNVKYSLIAYLKTRNTRSPIPAFRSLCKPPDPRRRLIVSLSPPTRYFNSASKPVLKMADNSYGPDYNEGILAKLIKYLRHRNPQKLIIAFLRKFKGVIGSTFHKGINFARKNDLYGYIQYIGSAEFREALWGTVKKHKWIIFFFCLGILLMCNPLAIAGFTSKGIAAGVFPRICMNIRACVY